jgi:ferrous iron transport protein A
MWAGQVLNVGDEDAGGVPPPPDRSLVEVTLADLLPGGRAVVVEVYPSGGRTTARRLEDLGFRPGTAVEVVRRAPLRDPVVYRLRGCDICLRRFQASLIRVAVAS